MTRDRAIEIIAAYGADAARWPDDERAAVLAFADDPAIVAERAAAAALDVDLRLWAAMPVAAAAPLAIVPARRDPWRWAAGGSVAAALLASIVLTRVPDVPVAAPASVSDEQAFAMLFTPTLDEENMI